MGQSWESVVIETLLRGFAAAGVDCCAYHYRTGGGAEIDLLLEGEFGVVPVEIKHTQHVDARSLRGLRDFVAERNCRCGIAPRVRNSMPAHRSLIAETTAQA